MPLINPDEIIKDNFKILSRQRRNSRCKKEAKKETQQVPVQHDQCGPVIPPTSTTPPTISPVPPSLAEIEVQPSYRQEHFEEALLLPETSDHHYSLVSSLISTNITKPLSMSTSHGDEFSTDSVYILEEQPDKSLSSSLVKILDKIENLPSNQTRIKMTPIVKNVDEENNETVVDDKEKQKPRENRSSKRDNNERRKRTVIPCSCPQYKVSRDLATKWDLQGIFFGKILVVKILQLFVINLITLFSVFGSDSTSDFLLKCHDWAYMAYAIFVGLLVCIRWGLGFRSRWPLAVSFALMIPLTLIIAFICACITSIHFSMIIPMVTCTLFLTFLMLCFTPYLLRKSVMHRSTNFAGSALALLSSLALIFLKEFEVRPITYMEFVSRVWLPAMVLSQIAVQITVFDIQRVIFGLSFNVSTKRWHIAAMYI